MTSVLIYLWFTFELFFFNERACQSVSSKTHAAALRRSAPYFAYKKTADKSHTLPLSLGLASISNTMRAESSLLLCFLVLHALAVQASEGGENKLHDLLPNKNLPLQPDNEADQFTDLTDTKPDMWTEFRLLRNMVAEQNVELQNMKAKLRETETQVDEQKLDLLTTKTTLNELRTAYTAMKVRLRTSEKQGDDLKKAHTAQSMELTNHREMLNASEMRVEEIMVSLQDHTDELKSTRARVEKSENELQLLKPRMDDIQAQNAAQAADLSFLMERAKATEHQLDIQSTANPSPTQVAFYAALTNSGAVGPYNTPQLLKFTKVFTNVGQAYNASTGFFTAPVKGLYSLRFTVCSGLRDESVMGVMLFHNGRPIMYNLQTVNPGGGQFEYLSNAVVLELNVGDELYLVLPEGMQVFDNPNNHSTFTAFLLSTV